MTSNYHPHPSIDHQLTQYSHYLLPYRYFAGESHAGHYIPNMISHILSKNREFEATDHTNGGIYIDVQGAAMGDPWMDPKNQYDATELAHSLGIISKGQENYLDELRGKCRQALKAGKLNVKECYALLDDVVDSSSVAGMPKVLMYDARQYVHSTSSFPPGHQDLEKCVPPSLPPCLLCVPATMLAAMLSFSLSVMT